MILKSQQDCVAWKKSTPLNRTVALSAFLKLESASCCYCRRSRQSFQSGYRERKKITPNTNVPDILNLLRVNADNRAQPTLVVGLVSRVTRHPKRAEQDLIASVGNDSAVGECVG
jgi:hypothetical protein